MLELGFGLGVRAGVPVMITLQVRVVGIRIRDWGGVRIKHWLGLG